MLAGTDERLRVPRRPVPRTDVPALAVAVANEQATIYPVLMPGGWNVIGTALENVYERYCRYRIGQTELLRART